VKKKCKHFTQAQSICSNNIPLSKARPRKTEKGKCGRSKSVTNTPDKRLLKSQEGYGETFRVKGKAKLSLCLTN
jgi:hypothetical protein